jgi:hypothetical protein
MPAADIEKAFPREVLPEVLPEEAMEALIRRVRYLPSSLRVRWRDPITGLEIFARRHGSILTAF